MWYLYKTIDTNNEKKNESLKLNLMVNEQVLLRILPKIIKYQ